MQLHIVRDPNQSLSLLRDWKAQGISRYVGITSSFDRDYAAVEACLKKEKPEFFQIDVVRAASADPAVRTRIFASMDLAANVLTLGLQFVVTGKLIQRLGAGPAAAILPCVFATGFAALVLAPGLATIVAFQALQRTVNFAFSNPARELLFTSVAREEKYKAKNLIDTVVFRGGDVVWSWTFSTLAHVIGTALGVAALAIPVMIGWAVLALRLGRAQERRLAKEQKEPEGDPA
jgi:AAA family ATP:ADP antiporter